jgi:hypothetical protein
MNTDTNLFFSEVTQSFQYLLSDYHYKFVAADIKDPDDFRDTYAVVRYLANKVAIEVWWYFAASVIGVTLLEVKKKGNYPYKTRLFGKSPGTSKAINLHTLLSMTGKDDLLILKNVNSYKESDISKRSTMIENDMGKIVRNVAEVLKTQAHDILAGNTFIFLKVQKYEEESVRKRYPSLY